MANRVRIAVGRDRRDLFLVDDLAEGFARARGLADADRAQLVEVVHRLVTWVNDSAYPNDQTGEIAVQLELGEGAVRVLVEDWGEPLAAFGGGLGPAPEDLAGVDALTDDLRLVNLGREGKRLSASVPAEGVAPEELVALADFAREAPPGEVTADQVEIVEATGAQAEAISRLLYVNYGLGYGHPDFYRPLWVAEEIEAGRVFSTVAVLGGEVVGHHAMLREEGMEAGETGVAVVHPAYRGLGIFGRLFERTVKRARGAGVPSVFARAVTSHPYSQRAEHARGYRESALMLGSVPPGDGEEPAPRGSRGSQVSSEAPREHPVSMPARYSELLAAAYANLELETTGAETARARAELEGQPQVAAERDEQRESTVITVGGWGEEPRNELLDAQREAVRHHDDVAYCDLDLESLTASDLDEAVELLRNYDFFYCGLVLDGRADHDHLRMQAILTDNVELEKIVLDSDYAQGLKEAIFADRGWLGGA
ncbi:MAG: GNAT family N-acetyltransferase [Solirubrobacterales bacterium]